MERDKLMQFKLWGWDLDGFVHVIAGWSSCQIVEVCLSSCLFRACTTCGRLCVVFWLPEFETGLKQVIRILARKSSCAPSR